MSTAAATAPAAAKAMFPAIPKEKLELALECAMEARRQAINAYHLLGEHYSLRIQCETTGKSAANLRDSIQARLDGRP